MEGAGANIHVVWWSTTVIVSPTRAVTGRPSSGSLKVIEDGPIEDGSVAGDVVGPASEAAGRAPPDPGGVAPAAAEGDLAVPHPAVAPSRRAKTRPVHRREDGFTATVWLALVPGRRAP